MNRIRFIPNRNLSDGPDRLSAGLRAGDGGRQLLRRRQRTRARAAGGQQADRAAGAGIRLAIVHAHHPQADADARGASGLRTGASGARHLRGGARQHPRSAGTAVRHAADQRAVIVRAALPDAGGARLHARISRGEARPAFRRAHHQSGRGGDGAGAAHRPARVEFADGATDRHGAALSGRDAGLSARARNAAHAGRSQGRITASPMRGWRRPTNGPSNPTMAGMSSPFPVR